MTTHTPPPDHSPARSSALRFFSRLARAVMLCAVFAAPVLSFAQATGVITGKILKPGTGEYVRYAQVRVAGTNQTAESDAEGVYVLTNIPAGNASVVVSYTGYETASATVAVAEGHTATQDFNLYTADQRQGENVVQLEKFTVNSVAEGQAKAVQSQRRSMTIGDHVSSDEFGDVVEGNVGEFLKHLPGVDLEYVQFDARGPRMRGLDPQYVGVTLDGVKLASADAFNATVGTDNQGTEGSRAFGFESISLSSIDAVEVYKNLSADMDADAPAGTINLRSKRAFDRAGRRISYSATASANSEEFHLKRTAGPTDDKTFKTRPSGSIEYSDVFLNRRLGIIFNYSNSSIYNEFQQFSMTTVNRTTTATDTRVAVPQTLTFTDGPKISDRETITFRADYKLSPTFSFGVNTTLAKYHAYWDNRQFRFVTSTNNTTAGTGRQTVVGEDPMISFNTSGTGTSLTLTGDGADKFTDTISVLPSFDWKPTPNLTIEGRFGWSESDNQYRALAEGKARSAAVNALSGIQYTAKRSSVTSGDWVLTQTGGLDWGNAANYLNPRVTDEARTDYNEVYTGGIDTTWKKPVLGFPAFLKFGLRGREDYRKFTDRRPWMTYAYNGPGGGPTGSFGSIPLGDPIDLSGLGSYFPSITGLPPGFADRSLAANLFNEHPEYWTNAAAQTPDNYYSSFIANNRSIKETVNAAYLMGNVTVRKLQLQGGVRYEQTTDELAQLTRRTDAETIAAGYQINASTGRATTIPGLQYQFQSLPGFIKETDYDHVFLSAAAKYSITENLIAQIGVHEAIRRPQLTVLSGVTTVVESAAIISVPNPGLKPEESLNVSAKLAYYLPTSGSTISIGAFQIEVEKLFLEMDRAPGTWGDDYPELRELYGEDYTLRTVLNSENKRRFRGLEFEYRQNLTFLPKALKRSSVYVNYLRNYADIRRGGMSPHQVKVGGSLSYKRFALGANANWTDDTPWTNAPNAIQYRGARTLVDASASYIVNRWATLVVSARDIGNVGQELYEFRNGREELVRKDIYGTLWTFSVKGTF